MKNLTFTNKIYITMLIETITTNIILQAWETLSGNGRGVVIDFNHSQAFLFVGGYMENLIPTVGEIQTRCKIRDLYGVAIKYTGTSMWHECLGCSKLRWIRFPHLSEFTGLCSPCSKKARRKYVDSDKYYNNAYYEEDVYLLRNYKQPKGNRYPWTLVHCPACKERRVVAIADIENIGCHRPICKKCHAKRAFPCYHESEDWPAWKKEVRHKNIHGYVYVRISGNSSYIKMARIKAMKNCILEHRLVMAEHLGRILKPWELVHHKNHKKDDNRLENLELLSRCKHGEEHIQWSRLTERINKLEQEVKFWKKRCGE